MKHFISLLITVAFSVTAIAQSGAVKGIVKHESEPVEFANVGLKGSAFGTSTDEIGKFQIENIPAGKYELVVSVLGYKKFVQPLTVKSGETISINANLEKSSLNLDQVVVTGTMKESFTTASPVKVDVVTSKFLEKTSPVSLVESVQMINGVQEVVACGVCFTNSISINGLPGPYTAVLVDGTPMYGNLASVYGLNGIPTTIIDRIEVIKGPSSTLYGSEAIAGVINVITKDPKDQPRVAFDFMGTSHMESFNNVSVAPKVGKWNGLIGVNHAYINLFEDENNDGFSDIINMDRVSAFTKWSMDRENDRKFTIAGKYYWEDRRNGVKEFLEDRAYRDIRGSDSIYGESIYTRRAEVFGTYELPTSENFKLDYSFSHHEQDSYYGADQYVAQQDIAFGNFLWFKKLGKHDLTLGSTIRYQYYDDNTVATEDTLGNRASNQFIPGIFVQDEWDITEKFTALPGARLDHYDDHGPIFSPRLNLKYKPGVWTTFRVNFGTGFRVVNLFTEDHAFVTGNRSVEIRENLEPERSYNGAFNFNHIFSLGNTQGTIDLDAYYTYFTNAILPNYDEAGKIIYENMDGHAETKGVGISVNHELNIPISYNVGFNFQEATQTDKLESGETVTTPLEFAVEWSGVSTVSYRWKKPKVQFDWTTRVTGPMQLPEVYDLNANGEPVADPRPTRSKPFTIMNLQVSKQFSSTGLKLYVGVQNILDYRQPYTPLTGYDDPNAPSGFSEYFDTAYAYAPIHGRELYFGVKWALQ